jgi:hypothetical protein
MSEEQEQSTGSSLKNVIIGFISTITLGVGGWVTTKLTGSDKEEEKPAATQPAIIINNTQQQQQAASGKTVIIKEKEAAAKPADQPKPKKKEGDEFKEEAPKW